MKISYNWLSTYLPEKIEINRLSEILTGIGLEVGGMEEKEAVRGGLKGLVVGLVEECVAHPNSDHLHVTKVRIDDDTVLPIVCGAANVAAGQKVIVATVGTTLYDKEGNSFKIKKSKLRGEPSEGMICAEDEIGMGESHDGILVLPVDTPIGLPASYYFQLPEGDTIMDVDLTPNRSDAFSHLGVARDVCAYLSCHSGKQISAQYPELKPLRIDPEKLPMEVEIKDKDACLRYAGVIIKNIHVGPSPDWLKQRLQSIGLQSINNVVDATNFVLNEYGQPLHAFDYDRIRGSKIVVSKLAVGTVFKTLDEKEQKLSSEDLMICDGDLRPMCMAGVYGGFDSGVSSKTQTVFLESAYFNPRTLRRSSLRHDLRTDAVLHFEKGVEMQFVLPALKRAANLLVEIAGGKVASDVIDVYPQPQPDRKIKLSFDYLTRICGKQYDKALILPLFETLGYNAKAIDDQSIEVSIPFENRDIFQPADLAEEVLRIDGLNSVPIPTRINYTLNESSENSAFRHLKERLAQSLTHVGFQEILTNSITSSKFYPEETHLVKLINSLSSELDILRPNMLNSGLEVIAYNINRKMADLSFYEFGKTYSEYQEGEFDQTEWLALWMIGNVREQDWTQKAESSDLFYLKGVIENLFIRVGLSKVQEVAQEGKIVWQRGKDSLIGRVRKVTSTEEKLYGIKQPVYFAEIHLRNLFEAVHRNAIHHQNPSKFPSVSRDLALVVSKSVKYQDIDKIVNKQKFQALQGYKLFDIFESEKIGKDKKSMALSFTFQLTDRTLKDNEVDKMMQQLVDAFTKNLNAEVRS